MNAIDAYLTNLVDVVEGSTYTNDPADHGGATKYGITLRTLSRVRGRPVSADDVKNLTRDEALAIYRSDYVTLPGFDKIAAVAMDVALEMIDTGVNMGPAQAARYLQRSLNVLNLNGAAWPVLATDGQCGPKTVRALQTYVLQRGDRGIQVLVAALNCLQGSDYIGMAESDPSQQRFIYGWLNQRVFQNLADWACGATT